MGRLPQPGARRGIGTKPTRPTRAFTKTHALANKMETAIRLQKKSKGGCHIQFARRGELQVQQRAVFALLVDST